MHAWPRQEHYRYFGELDDPYFGITAKADFTSCYMQSKQDGASFFLYSLHKILRAANAIDEFRYRVEDGNIVLYDLIGASPTIGREDGSFDFGVFEYHEDRKLFVEEASREIARVKNEKEHFNIFFPPFFRIIIIEIDQSLKFILSQFRFTFKSLFIKIRSLNNSAILDS